MLKQGLKLALIIVAIAPGAILGCQAGAQEPIPREDTVDTPPESPASDSTESPATTATSTNNQNQPGVSTASTSTTKVDGG
jgi:hypothetical protein